MSDKWSKEELDQARRVAQNVGKGIGDAFRALQVQKPVDPSHDKTVINGKGGKQSVVEFACGSTDPLALLAVAKVQAEGDAKYGKDNWRLIDEDDHLGHALTHIQLHRIEDSGEAHLAHAATRILMALAKHLRPEYLGDAEPVPCKEPKK